jgi:hypothetical protein
VYYSGFVLDAFSCFIIGKKKKEAGASLFIWFLFGFYLVFIWFTSLPILVPGLVQVLALILEAGCD